MRRNAGDFLRKELNRLSLLELTGAGIGIGVTLGAFIVWALGPWIGHIWAMAACAVFAMALLGIRWNLDNLEKGFDAETRVGQAIEYAITRDGCAFAHTVTTIAKVGDIDHIVATPMRLWVVETKYTYVPKGQFPKALSRIAANTRAVRRWAPEGTPVRGCLVIAYEQDFDPEYDWFGEKISAHTPDSLVQTLRSEAREKQSIDKGIARDVWKLGRTVDPDASDTDSPKAHGKAD